MNSLLLVFLLYSLVIPNLHAQDEAQSSKERPLTREDPLRGTDSEDGKPAPTGITTASGQAYVPVIVMIRVGKTGLTNGVEVQLIDAGDKREKPNLRRNDVLLWTIDQNLGKPVKTDENSCALLWMSTKWVSTTRNGETSYQRLLRGRLRIGPVDRPYLDKPLKDLIANRRQVESEDGPIVIEVTLSKERIALEERRREDKRPPRKPLTVPKRIER